MCFSYTPTRVLKRLDYTNSQDNQLLHRFAQFSLSLSLARSVYIHGELLWLRKARDLSIKLAFFGNGGKEEASGAFLDQAPHQLRTELFVVETR